MERERERERIGSKKKPKVKQTDSRQQNNKDRPNEQTKKKY